MRAWPWGDRATRTGGVRELVGASSPAWALSSPCPCTSHDQRFFLKTQRPREVRALLAHLPRYLQHLQRHPHSLLARLLGRTGQGPGTGGERGQVVGGGRGPGNGDVLECGAWGI